MRSRTLALLVGSGAFLALALWIARPPASLANGDKHDDDKGGHAHVPAPLEYADAHVPLGVWTDPAMIARGKEIYTTRCGVCHGDAGDGKGPGGVAVADRAQGRVDLLAPRDHRGIGPHAEGH